MRKAKTYIATNSQSIRQVCEGFGAEVIFSTSPAICGTHRVVQAFLKHLPLGDEDTVVNVQAEWPTIEPDGIRQIIREVAKHHPPTLASLYYKGAASDDPNLVKVVLADHQRHDGSHLTPRAIYFSRSSVPYGATEFNYHIGAYAMNRRMAQDFGAIATRKELHHFDSENLEQLSLLGHNYPIWMFETKPAFGIDTREQYDRIKDGLCSGSDIQVLAGCSS